MSKNPFQVIGITPDALRGLNKKQIQTLIKHFSRGLSNVHHPDIGGSEEKMSEINLALEELRKPELFLDNKTKYLKKTPLKKQIDDLEEQLKIANRLLLNQSNVILDYLKSFHGIQEENELGTIFDSAGFYVSDILSSLFLKGQINSPQDSLDLLEIKKGVITKTHFFQKNLNSKITKDSVEVCENERLMGTLSEEATFFLGGFKAVLMLLQGYDKNFSKGKIMITGRAKKKVCQNRIDMNNMKAVLGYLSPRINRGDLVFAINKGKDPTVSLLGKVVEKPSRIVND